jgi:hypothetical protein
MANQFIQTMNASFKTNIPLANVASIAMTDPEVP